MSAPVHDAVRVDDPAPPARSRRGPSAADLGAGAAAGLFSVPEGMAYAAVGGFSPAAGLYAEIAPAILALIAFHPHPLWVMLLVYATVIVTVISGLDYFFGVRRRLGEADASAKT